MWAKHCSRLLQNKTVFSARFLFWRLRVWTHFQAYFFLFWLLTMRFINKYFEHTLFNSAFQYDSRVPAKWKYMRRVISKYQWMLYFTRSWLSILQQNHSRLFTNLYNFWAHSNKREVVLCNHLGQSGKSMYTYMLNVIACTILCNCSSWCVIRRNDISGLG